MCDDDVLIILLAVLREVQLFQCLCYVRYSCFSVCVM